MRISIFLVLLLFTSATHASEQSLASYICEGISNPAEQRSCLQKAEATHGGRIAHHAKENERPNSFTPWLFLNLSWIWWLLYLLFGLILARYVYRDAKRRDWLFLGISPVWWAVITIAQPPLGLLAYWAMHYSRFAVTHSEANSSASKPNRSE
jgi:hypothetical protein